jgi:L-serine deaminase
VDVHRLVLLPRGEVRVSAPTERDYRGAEIVLAFTAGACSVGIGLMLVLTFSGRLLCN